MKRFSKFKYPNKLFFDERISRAAKVVGGVMYASRNALGVCRKSYKELGELAGVSSDTVLKAVKELESTGYVTKANTHYYNRGQGKVVRGKNLYTCNLNVLREGYTFLPREVFRNGLTISQQLVYISLYITAGNRRRAFPSIREMSEASGCCRSTICEALKVLKKLPELMVRLCKKRSGAFAASSYIFVTVLAGRGQEIVALRPRENHAGNGGGRLKPRRLLSAIKQKVKEFLIWVGGSPIFRQLC